MQFAEHNAVKRGQAIPGVAEALRFRAAARIRDRWVCCRAMEFTRQRWLGVLLAALAAAGLWSSLHQLAQLGEREHGHHSLLVLLAPHHLVTILGPLTPLLLLVAAAIRARRCGGTVVSQIGGRALVGSTIALEGAELLSGSMAHGWLVTVALVLVAVVVSWIVGRIALQVVRAVARRFATRRSHPRARHAACSYGLSLDTRHPSRTWLARRSRRGPPARRSCATA